MKNLIIITGLMCLSSAARAEFDCTVKIHESGLPDRAAVLALSVETPRIIAVDGELEGLKATMEGDKETGSYMLRLKEPGGLSAVVNAGLDSYGRISVSLRRGKQMASLVCLKK